MNLNNLEKFRARLASDRICLGMVISLSDPSVSEIAGELGFDFTWIDAEHCPLNIETILGHLQAVRGSDCAPLVRVQWNEWGIIKPILDLAPAGVIIPMVNSAAEAEEAVASCKYPPRGKRGCAARRGRRYGLTPFFDYLASSEADPMVILQVEHIDAVRELDAILRVPGIDSICIGPADLSGSMGKLCRFDDPEVSRVIDEVAAKVKAAGLPLGTADALTPEWRRRGIDWIACAGDTGAIVSAARSTLASLRELSQKRE